MKAKILSIKEIERKRSNAYAYMRPFDFIHSQLNSVKKEITMKNKKGVDGLDIISW